MLEKETKTHKKIQPMHTKSSPKPETKFPYNQSNNHQNLPKFHLKNQNFHNTQIRKDNILIDSTKTQ